MKRRIGLSLAIVVSLLMGVTALSAASAPSASALCSPWQSGTVGSQSNFVEWSWNGSGWVQTTIGSEYPQPGTCDNDGDYVYWDIDIAQDGWCIMVVGYNPSNGFYEFGDNNCGNQVWEYNKLLSSNGYTDWIAICRVNSSYTSFNGCSSLQDNSRA